MNHFMEFFRIKTGIDWEDRVIKEKTMPTSFFQYAPPVSFVSIGGEKRADQIREVESRLVDDCDSTMSTADRSMLSCEDFHGRRLSQLCLSKS